jgi:hypothetical protein
MTKAKRYDKTIHKTTKKAVIKLLTLKKDEVADIHLRVAVMPEEETKNFPPEFDSLVLEEMIGFKKKGVRLFGGKKAAQLKLDPLHQAFGGPNYPNCSARVAIEENSLYLTIEADQVYYWNVSHQGVLYPPEETKECGTAFTRDETLD